MDSMDLSAGLSFIKLTNGGFMEIIGILKHGKECLFNWNLKGEWIISNNEIGINTSLKHPLMTSYARVGDCGENPSGHRDNLFYASKKLPQGRLLIVGASNLALVLQ